jgi:hypothetical protein
MLPIIARLVLSTAVAPEVWFNVKLLSSVSVDAKYNDCDPEPPNVRLLDDDPLKAPATCVMAPLAMSVFEPITKDPLVSASVPVTVVVPARFNVPPLIVIAAKVAAALIVTVPDEIVNALIVAASNVSVPPPLFVRFPDPLKGPEISKAPELEKVVEAERLSGQEIVAEEGMDVLPVAEMVNITDPEMEVPAPICFIVLQTPADERIGLNAIVPPSTGIITSEVDVGIPPDQFDAKFQFELNPFQVLSVALDI